MYWRTQFTKYIFTHLYGTSRGEFCRKENGQSLSASNLWTDVDSVKIKSYLQHGSLIKLSSKITVEQVIDCRTAVQLGGTSNIYRKCIAINIRPTMKRISKSVIWAVSFIYFRKRSGIKRRPFWHVFCNVINAFKCQWISCQLLQLTCERSYPFQFRIRFRNWKSSLVFDSVTCRPHCQVTAV
jgi:hypothetical protein